MTVAVVGRARFYRCRPLVAVVVAAVVCERIGRLVDAVLGAGGRGRGDWGLALLHRLLHRLLDDVEACRRVVLLLLLLQQLWPQPRRCLARLLRAARHDLLARTELHRVTTAATWWLYVEVRHADVAANRLRGGDHHRVALAARPHL
ncbi:hypothetical protein NP493_205g02005 [Ridgeia piscesae]|uniref:Uncharacterized protein n=1 Tax=Ridgeia piscesae TaxID=27915 RepID=A0AAD9P1D1_RIDPI|nr:hypothetical protein NP493_205g02005 [Ridgeia piscesae]